MPNVQIREVPDDVHNELVRRAERAGQSLQQYLSAQLASIAATRRSTTYSSELRTDRRVSCRRLAPSLLLRTNVLVVDASVIAPAIADGGPDGDACRMRIKGQSLAAPDLLRLETMSVLPGT